MFDKKKCKTCRYSARLSDAVLICGYCLYRNNCCTDKYGNDRRGDNPKACKLYETRESIRSGRLY